MFRKTRIKWAFRFGRSEHKAGRVLGLYLFILTFVSYFFLDLYTTIILSIGFIIWLWYICSHILEKKFFGKHGPRSGWK